jgi:hypothetical protein
MHLIPSSPLNLQSSVALEIEIGVKSAIELI